MEEKTLIAMLDSIDPNRIVYPSSWNLSAPVTTDIIYSKDSGTTAQSVNSSVLSTWNQTVFSSDMSDGSSISSDEPAERAESHLTPRVLMSPSIVDQVGANKLQAVQPNYNSFLIYLLLNPYKNTSGQMLPADNQIESKRVEKTMHVATTVMKINGSSIVRAIQPKPMPLKNLLKPVLSGSTDHLKNTGFSSQLLPLQCRQKLRPLHLVPLTQAKSYSHVQSSGQSTKEATPGSFSETQPKEYQGTYKPVSFIRALINYATNDIQLLESNKTQDIKSNQTQPASYLNTFTHEADKASRKNETAPSSAFQIPASYSITSAEKDLASDIVHSYENNIFSNIKDNGHKNVSLYNTSMPLKHTDVYTEVFSESDVLTNMSVMQNYELNYTVVESDLNKTDYFLNQTVDISNRNDKTIPLFSSHDYATQPIRSTSSFVIGIPIKFSTNHLKTSVIGNSENTSSHSPIIRNRKSRLKLSNNDQIMNLSDNETQSETVNQSAELTNPARKSQTHFSNANIKFSDQFSVDEQPASVVSVPKPIGLNNFIPVQFVDVAGSSSFHVNR